MTKKYILKPRLSDKGFPQSSKFYKEAHQAADKAEKKAFPKDYEKMKKVDAKLPRHELAGKNFPSGKIEVSKKVPKQYRNEVALHEKVENRIAKSLKQKARKK